MGTPLDLETKRESSQWKHLQSPPPRKFKVIKSVGKIMVSVFSDAFGVLLVDFLEPGRTINGDYYASLLEGQKFECLKLFKMVKNICAWYSSLTKRMFDQLVMWGTFDIVSPSSQNIPPQQSS